MTGIIRFGRNALGWGAQPSTNWRRSGTLNVPAASLPTPTPVVPPTGLAGQPLGILFLLTWTA